MTEKNRDDERPDYQHLVRIVSIGLFLIVFIFAAKLVLTPKSFGKYGHYRADAVTEAASRPIKYIGSEACTACHDDKAADKAKGVHKVLVCEVCHSAGAKHAVDPVGEPLYKPHTRDFCGKCHAKKVSRPKNFPQIDMQKHYPNGLCQDCHNPHNPVIAGGTK